MISAAEVAWSIAALASLVAALGWWRWWRLRALLRTGASPELAREQLDLVLRATQAGVWDRDFVGGQVYLSPRLKEILGIPAARPLDFDVIFRDRVHPADRLRMQEAETRHFADDIPFDHEYRLRHEDGHYVWVHARALSLRGTEGSPLRFVGSIIDVSDRKSAEEVLRSRERHYRQLVETSNSLIWSLDVRGKVRFVNRRGAMAVLGYEPEEMVGRHFLEFAHGRDRNRDALTYDEVLQSRGLSTAITRWRHKDGRNVFLSVNIAVTREVTGRVLGTLGTATDIGEQVAREKALTEANRRALEGARAKAEFLATMSHEIRTPLNGVIATTSLLLETNLSTEQQEYVETVRTSGESLLAVINDILDFSRIDSGKLQVEQVPFAIENALDDTLDILGDRVRNRPLELVYKIAPEVPAVLIGDLARVRQIVLNLVSNAVKFTTQGEVVVAVGLRQRKASGVLLEIAVRDTGVGIPADKLDQLFQAFMQADSSTTRKFGGSGLGLAISKRLAELMGGTITVASTEGVGSCFTCTLQLGIESPASPDAMGAMGPAALRSSVNESLRGRRVLVIDPNPASRSAMSDWLVDWGMRPFEADDAESAHGRIAGDRPPDLIVASSGNDPASVEAFAHRLRENGVTGRIPIVLISSWPRRHLGVGCRDVFDAVLLKPVKPRALAAALVDVGMGTMPALSPVGPLVSPATSTERLAPLEVLLVEDHEVNQRLAMRMLQKLGCTVDTADNGREGVDRIRAKRYAIVFMDMQMPEVDGLEATRRVRASLPATKQPTIVAMTANALAEDRARCLDAGMDDYMTKPLLRDALSRMLRKWGAKAVSEGKAPQADAATMALRAAAEPEAPMARPSAMAAIDSIVDRARVRELRELDDPGEQHFAQLVEIYAAATIRQLAALRRANAENDTIALRDAAHALKGASINLGAPRVAQLSRALELAAGDRGDSTHLDAIGVLEGAVTEAVSALRELAAERIPAAHA